MYAGHDYRRFQRRKGLYIGAFAVLLVGSGLFAISVGSADISLADVFYTLVSRFTPASYQVEELSQNIIMELRLPRVLMAIVAGAGLAMAGVLLQALLKNPLASPYTLGIGSAASFGAALALILGVGVTGSTGFAGKWMIAGNAFLTSLIPAAVIFALVRYKSAKASTMVLAGIAMMYLFSASTSLLQYVGSEDEVTAVVYWMFGSLSRTTWESLAIVTLVTVPMFLVAFRLSWDLNAILQGEDVAKSLGVDTLKLRGGGMVAASLVTGVTIAFLGTIGFIGLVAPHIARMLIGSDHKYLIPAAALLGSVLLVASDAIARTVISPTVLPVGIVTSFMGVPLFFYLILRRRREYW
ncbi:FecCD family ABC transporter permease [Halobacteriaceae archaeon GCM10025711]